MKEAEFKALAPAMGKAVSDAFEKRWRAFVNGMDREKERGEGREEDRFLGRQDEGGRREEGVGDEGRVLGVQCAVMNGPGDDRVLLFVSIIFFHFFSPLV